MTDIGHRVAMPPLLGAEHEFKTHLVMRPLAALTENEPPGY